MLVIGQFPQRLPSHRLDGLPALVADRLGGISSGTKVLAVPEDVRSCWEVLDSTHQFVAVPLVESASLKGVGEVDGL